MVAIWMSLACSVLAASEGELWLVVEQQEQDGDRVSLTLPASSLREPGPPAILETTAGSVDLRPIASRLRPGAERVYTLPDGDRAVLRHAPHSNERASDVSFALTGPKGNGLTFSFALTPEEMKQIGQRSEVNVDLGLPIGFDEEGCAQLKRSPPISLLEVVGPAGGGLKVATR